MQDDGSRKFCKTKPSFNGQSSEKGTARRQATLGDEKRELQNKVAKAIALFDDGLDDSVEMVEMDSPYAENRMFQTSMYKCIRRKTNLQTWGAGGRWCGVVRCVTGRCLFGQVIRRPEEKCQLGMIEPGSQNPQIPSSRIWYILTHHLEKTSLFRFGLRKLSRGFSKGGTWSLDRKHGQQTTARTEQRRAHASFGAIFHGSMRLICPLKSHGPARAKAWGSGKAKGGVPKNTNDAGWRVVLLLLL
ncbi:hypothetical protein HDV57DRAFT_185834 [Trichoderma longibrachiatum]|uniref:Uncharacterized protein n=1 Tax=Trichoderma longibrachiatum ATCC 18648 TaxID=983965 RepID=A0A2T4BZH4_TRILO|nr:hypothetical protein M440DRAFT_1031143 [Trichoderma longibrachiatum ATCC 18648]